MRTPLAAALLALLITPPLAAQARTPAPPRAVTPRGPLAAEELNNIAVFKAASPSVVDITALGLERLQLGDNCTLTLWRAGATRKLTVTLAEAEE